MNYLNNKKEIIIYPWLKNIKTITVAKFLFYSFHAWTGTKHHYK